MPNITLIRSHLFASIGREYTDKEFDELCFEFGVEVDDVETQMIEVNTRKLTAQYQLCNLIFYFFNISLLVMGQKLNI